MARPQAGSPDLPELQIGVLGYEESLMSQFTEKEMLAIASMVFDLVSPIIDKRLDEAHAEVPMLVKHAIDSMTYEEVRGAIRQKISDRFSVDVSVSVNEK